MALLWTQAEQEILFFGAPVWAKRRLGGDEKKIKSQGRREAEGDDNRAASQK